MSSSFNDSLRFLYSSPHSQNFYTEFQCFPQRVPSPVTVIMLLCICKGIRRVQNLSESCSALFGAGRKGSTFHFYRCAAFGFPVRYHIPCFSEKAICRPCDALTEGKAQRTEGLFYGLHRFRGRFCISVSTPHEPAVTIFLHPQAMRQSINCAAAGAPSGAWQRQNSSLSFFCIMLHLSQSGSVFPYPAPPPRRGRGGRGPPRRNTSADG